MGIRRGEIRRPAVFLDRDGTIIRQVELLHKFSQVRLFPKAAKAITILNNLAYLVIVVTNQPVVARGIMAPEEVEGISRIVAYPVD